MVKKNSLKRRVFKSVLWNKQKGICPYCGQRMSWKRRSKRFATFDHIIPKSKGGQWTEDNLVLCCRICNEQKGNRVVIKWRESKLPDHIGKVNTNITTQNLGEK